MCNCQQIRRTARGFPISHLTGTWTKLILKKINKKIQILKNSGPIASDFFSNFQIFQYQTKAHIFIITPGEFNSRKVYRMEDINLTYD